MYNKELNYNESLYRLNIPFAHRSQCISAASSGISTARGRGRSQNGRTQLSTAADQATWPP